MPSRISATESPTVGEGASERSMMPIWASSISAASRATSSPTRVILNVVRLIRSARSVNDRSGWRATTLRITPGPEMATLMLTSGSPLPCSAPAMKGLSSGTLQKVTILAQPIESWSAVRARPSSSTSAILVDGVHVDAGARGGHVDRRADALASRRWPRESASISAASPSREALLHQGREAADEVDADLGGGRVERVRDPHEGVAVVRWRPRRRSA